MTDKFDAFNAELEALCIKHGVQLFAQDGMQVWLSEDSPDETILNGLEDCTDIRRYRENLTTLSAGSRIFLDGHELPDVKGVSTISLVRERDVIEVTNIDDEPSLPFDRYLWLDGHEAPTDGTHELVVVLPDGSRIETKCEGCRMPEEYDFRPALLMQKSKWITA